MRFARIVRISPPRRPRRSRRLPPRCSHRPPRPCPRRLAVRRPRPSGPRLSTGRRGSSGTIGAFTAKTCNGHTPRARRVCAGDTERKVDERPPREGERDRLDAAAARHGVHMHTHTKTHTRTHRDVSYSWPLIPVRVPRRDAASGSTQRRHGVRSYTQPHTDRKHLALVYV